MSGQRKSPSHHDYDTSRLRSWCDPNGRTADKSCLLTGSVSALKRDVLNLSFGRKRKGKNWLDSEFMKFYQEKLGCKNKRAPTGIPIIIKKKKKTSVGEDVEKSDPSCLAGGVAESHSLRATQAGGASERSAQSYPATREFRSR